MLVYANQLRVQGSDAERAVSKAIGGWLKEQLGFGLRPDQLKQDGEHTGHRGERRSWLRIYACYNGEPALCAWVLKHADEDVRGRQWIVEVGVKKSAAAPLEVSCVVKTNERSTLVSNPVSASQPRVIQYIVNNVHAAKNADFADAVPGENLKTVGQDRDSYLAFLAEIERHDRDAAIILVSATHERKYLVNPTKLQGTLIGLAYVVQVLPESNSYEMAEVLGKRWSAWGGAVNVLSIPSASGDVRSRYFLRDEIQDWGEEPQRISQVLAWVTSNTNIPRLRMHVRPEGVMQLSMRRRMEKVRATSAQMNEAQLRHALDDASKRTDELERFYTDENTELAADRSRYKEALESEQEERRKQDFHLRSLKAGLSNAGGDDSGAFDSDVLLKLLKLASGKEEPSPLDCLEIIEQTYGDRCKVLDSARSSARKMTQFSRGRNLLGLLLLLVTTYRDGLKDGGDSKARRVLGKSYAAKESTTVMKNPDMRRRRIFDYDGTQVEMFQHLKIGVDDDQTRTIRVHFHWDGDRQKMVIGHCGEHLPVSSH